MHLYTAPANRFVAGFIGSPSMNFLQGRLHHDGQYYFAGEDPAFRIALGSEISDGLKKYTDKPLTAGIRPEDVHLSNNKDHPAHLVLPVNAFENMGNEQLIYLSMSDRLLIARRSSRDIQSIGERVPVNFDVSKLCFFDTESGVAI